VVEQEQVFLSRGTDIMFALDESPSMSAQDFRPENRFEAAKEVIRGFVSGRSNDRIGLVGFGSETLLRVPPTLDYAALLATLEGLSVMGLGEGTAIGMGIAVAALHLSASDSPNRVVVLLTDGENNSGEIQPQTAAEIARQLDIRIYCIGIGEEGETTLRFVDPLTGRETSGTYIGKFDEELLRATAAVSGGMYFHAGTPGTLKRIFREIDALETSEKRVRIYTRHDERYLVFLVLAVSLLGAEFLLRHLLVREAL
jgi:Ca-activated chloride channel family protein